MDDYLGYEEDHEDTGAAAAMRVLRAAQKRQLAGPNPSVGQTLRQNDAPVALVPSTGVEPRKATRLNERPCPTQPVILALLVRNRESQFATRCVLIHEIAIDILMVNLSFVYHDA